ncbi:MAG TPA: LLM class flavin-dependent oxidoreductase [Actinomycetota bacterium]|nr:LLM class flavin-dependent oxidoreductase [Actinomycetota bacterium]
MPPLRFGVVRIQNRPWDELVADFRQIEAWGFDNAWIYDHLSWPSRAEPDRDKPWFECWVTLGALFEETSTLRIGPLVASMTLRNPTMLAAHAMTAHQISGGRLELGIGAAGAPRDHAATGVPEWSPSERAPRFGEYVEVVSRLLDGERVDYEGELYPVADAELFPEPGRPLRPPLTIAAHGPKALAVVARFADSWSSVAVPSSSTRGGRAAPERDEQLEVARNRNRMLDDLCAENGRNPRGIVRSFLTPIGSREPIPDVDTFSSYVADLKAAGMNEILMTWPDDRTQLDALASIADALPLLRTI